MVTLKSSRRFLAVHQRGRWLHSPCLSLGWLPSGERGVRVGIRTRRGMKGAVVRNRLKRQLRAALMSMQPQVRQQVDMIFVLHPPKGVATTQQLESEAAQLCRRAKLL
ncbi:MAG: ribonuclease P protein component [Candidatus Omnitrophica bacterium]|nr:ribonuclease P protein component [Candidatus Omnitrophota bacterium]